MLLLSLIMGAIVTGLAILFEWLLTYTQHFKIPEWLWWLLFFVVVIISFYYTTYYILMGRIKGIQQKIQKEGLVDSRLNKGTVGNLAELEERLEEWSETQSA